MELLFLQAEQAQFPQPLKEHVLHISEHLGDLLLLLQFILKLLPFSCIRVPKTGCCILDVILKYKKLFLNIWKKIYTVNMELWNCLIREIIESSSWKFKTRVHMALRILRQVNWLWAVLDSDGLQRSLPASVIPQWVLSGDNHFPPSTGSGVCWLALLPGLTSDCVWAFCLLRF